MRAGWEDRCIRQADKNKSTPTESLQQARHGQVGSEGPEILVSAAPPSNMAGWERLVPFLSRHHYEARRSNPTSGDVGFMFAGCQDHSSTGKKVRGKQMWPWKCPSIGDGPRLKSGPRCVSPATLPCPLQGFAGQNGMR